MRSLMVRFFLVAVSLLALAAARLRAEVKVSGALKVPTHDLVQLQAEGTAPGAVYFWSITPRLRPAQVKRGKGSIVFAAAPGVYTVNLRSVWIKNAATGELDGEEVEVEVVIGDKVPPFPDPKPYPPVPVPPVPEPKPPAPDVLKQLWILVVEETEQASADRGKFFASTTLAKYVKDKGHKFRCVDQDAKDAAGKTPADLAPWIARAKAKKLPVLFLVNQAGDVLFEGPVPATPGEVLAAIQKVGG